MTTIPRQPRMEDLVALLGGFDRRLRALEGLGPVLYDDGAPVFSDQNIRAGLIGVSFTGGQGTLTYPTAFPTATVAVVATARHVVGFNWAIAISDASPQWTATFVKLTAWQYDTTNPIGYYTGVVAVSYIAYGN